ncbi:hypothetical protein IOCL2690_000488600, partial [Leishmania lindenbergi]
MAMATLLSPLLQYTHTHARTYIYIYIYACGLAPPTRSFTFSSIAFILSLRHYTCLLTPQHHVHLRLPGERQRPPAVQPFPAQGLPASHLQRGQQVRLHQERLRDSHGAVRKVQGSRLHCTGVPVQPVRSPGAWHGGGGEDFRL